MEKYKFIAARIDENNKLIILANENNEPEFDYESVKTEYSERPCRANEFKGVISYCNRNELGEELKQRISKWELEHMIFPINEHHEKLVLENTFNLVPYNNNISGHRLFNNVTEKDGKLFTQIFNVEVSENEDYAIFKQFPKNSVFKEGQSAFTFILENNSNEDKIVSLFEKNIVNDDQGIMIRFHKTEIIERIQTKHNHELDSKGNPFLYYNYPIEESNNNTKTLIDYNELINSINNLDSFLIKSSTVSQLTKPVRFILKDIIKGKTEDEDISEIPVITASFFSPSQPSSEILFIKDNFYTYLFNDILIELAPNSKSTYTFIPKYNLI